ncbi:hypothetical protein [Aliiroseovarius marinus]|uniref:hypothetical protein n=1 Tax=Aliiroseovarius marinus TaxID=2500159 RepID=UPI002495A314|nr:hypothetical protein [Aliiroseovarius marinus]
MTEISKEQLMQLHRSGVAMSRSRLTYATPKQKTDWHALQQQSIPDALAEGAKSAAATDGQMSTKLAHLFSGSNQILAARSNLIGKLQSDVLSYVSKGHLHGYGYELPRYVSSTPVAIPNEAWNGKLDWIKGTLNYHGMQFVDVRLTTNRIRNEVLRRGNVDRTPPSAVGRPSVSEDILEAFNALSDADEIDTSKSLKWHYPKVRRWLELRKPQLPTPPKYISDETIRKNISPLFKELKKTKKQ